MRDQKRGGGELAQRAARGAIWTFADAWLGRLVSLGIFVLLGRLLEPRVFGLLALAMVVITFAELIAGQGFTRAIVQAQELEDRHLHSAFWATTIGGLLLGALVAGGGSAFARILGEPELAPVLQLLALALPISGVNQVASALLQRQMEFRALAIRRLASTAVAGIAAILVALLNGGVAALVTQVLVANVMNAVVLWVAVSWRPRLHFSRRHFKDLASFGRDATAINVLTAIGQRADDFVLGAIAGPVALGYYFVAYRILVVVTEALSTTFIHVSYPTFSRLVSDLPRLRRAYVAANRLSLMLVTPAFIGLILVARDAIVLLFGTKWIPSVQAMQLLALGGLLHAATRFTGSLLLSLSLSRRSLILTAARIGSLIPTFLVGAQWSFVGVASAFAIHSAAFLPVNVTVVRASIGLSVQEQLRPIIAPLLASVPMVVAVPFIQSALVSVPLVLRLAVTVTVGVVSYTGVLWLLDSSRIKEAFRYTRRGTVGMRQASSLSSAEARS